MYDIFSGSNLVNGVCMSLSGTGPILGMHSVYYQHSALIIQETMRNTSKDYMSCSFIYIYIYIKICNHHATIFCLHIYVSVNLWNQAICELSENFRQFVKCLFQSVHLFFYARKTLKPGLFWYAVEREPVRLESTNPKKKSQTLDAL